MTQCLTDKTVKGKNNQGPDAMTGNVNYEKYVILYVISSRTPFYKI